jgi:hypothetical protein
MVTVPAAPRQAMPPPPPPALAASLDFGELSRVELAEVSRAATRDVTPRSPFDLAEPTKTVVTRRGEAVPLRRLSPEERARYRRRLNLAFAALGMAVLAVALAVLLRIRP